MLVLTLGKNWDPHAKIWKTVLEIKRFWNLLQHIGLWSVLAVEVLTLQSCAQPPSPHSVWKSKEAWHNINCAFMLIRSYILQPHTWPDRDCQLSCSSGHAKSITYFWTDQAEIVTQVARKNKNITNESHWSFTSSTYIHANYSAVTVSDSDEIIVMFCIF